MVPGQEASLAPHVETLGLSEGNVAYCIEAAYLRHC